MRLAIRLLTLVAILGLGFAVAPDVSAAALGSIRGLVKDSRGGPLAGAAIEIVTGVGVGKARTDKIVRRGSTDLEGQFLAADIAPGKYRVKAEAKGFARVVVAAWRNP